MMFCLADLSDVLDVLSNKLSQHSHRWIPSCLLKPKLQFGGVNAA